MRARRLFLVDCLAALGSCSLGITSKVAGASEGVRLVMVVQKASPLNDLTARQIKNLYLGERVMDPSGRQLIPLNHPVGSPDRVGFDQTMLGMSPSDVGRYWIDRRIRGQSAPPKNVAPVDLLRRAVAMLPGTITYLRVNDVTADIKVLSIDSKAPNDPAYPLEY